MALFISHAQADKPLLDKFVDLLQTGLDISQKDIFCTSLEGLGIPRGQNFVSFIREKMADANFVIMMITPRYYESAFCLCELGATWITGLDTFPILVPPLGYESLKAVLIGVQSGAINDKDALNELRDRLTTAGLATAKTGRWESKRDEFITAFPRIQKKLSGHTSVPVAEHETLKETYAAAQASIEEKDAKIDDLEALVNKLKDCKDKTEVADVMREFSSDEEEFDRLRAEFRQLAREAPRAALEALYYYARGEEWTPRTGFGNEDVWESIDEAKERGFVAVSSSDRVTPDERHPKVQKLVGKLEELNQFMTERVGDDFPEHFAETHDYPFDMTNRDFWKGQIKP